MNYWLVKNMRDQIRERLGECRELGDEQIDFAVEVVLTHLSSASRTRDVVFEGATLAADLIRQRVNNHMGGNSHNVQRAEAAYQEWLDRQVG